MEETDINLTEAETEEIKRTVQEKPTPKEYTGFSIIADKNESIHIVLGGGDVILTLSRKKAEILANMIIREVQKE